MNNDDLKFVQAQEALNERMMEAQGNPVEISNALNGLELAAIDKNIIVKPHDVNPFDSLRFNEDGIVDKGYVEDRSYKNTDSGEMEQFEQMTVTAIVVSAGPACKYVKDGDVIFYTKPSAVSLPFLGEGFKVLQEGRVLAVVNEGLAERFKNL